MIESFAPYEEQLLQLPFVRGVRARTPSPGEGHQPDLVVRLRLVDGTQRQLLVEAKTSHLPSGAARHLRASLGDHPEDWLLVAPHVGAPLGDDLEAQGVQFIDQAGNCYLRIGARFVARIQGRSPDKPPARSKELRSAGYQVLLAILAHPDLVEATQREVAEAAGTSRQPVIDLFARLAEERVLTRRRKRYQWVLGPNGALMDRFLAGYRSHLRPKLYAGRFRLPASNPEELEAYLTEHLGGIRYGGTAGAHRLVGHYRGPDTVAYLGDPTSQRLRQLKASPTRAERTGDLVWMRVMGTASLEGQTTDTVHPLLIYAELMSDPDPRAGETARRVRERYLAWSI
ncbi:MAG: hypothetical protein KC619_24270 [Myxococcales bacterium]|nr:hypothetical protein [Myxococcales bacterium]